MINRRLFLKGLAALSALLAGVKKSFSYVGCRIKYGNQTRVITKYDPTTKVATIDKAWKTTPGAEDTVTFCQPVEDDV